MACDSRIVLLGADGSCRIPNEGESSDIDATLIDMEGSPLSVASILSIECTRQEEVTGKIINNRGDQDVLNKNGGSLTDGGGGTAAFKLKLDPADNVALRAKYALETHITTLVWTWVDGGGATRTGSQELVNSLNPRTPAEAAESPGWPG